MLDRFMANCEWTDMYVNAEAFLLVESEFDQCPVSQSLILMMVEERSLLYISLYEA